MLQAYAVSIDLLFVLSFNFTQRKTEVAIEITAPMISKFW